MRKKDTEDIDPISWHDMPLMLNEKQASKVLNIAVHSLRMYRSVGTEEGEVDGPPFVKLGHRVWYKSADLIQWVSELPTHVVIVRDWEKKGA